MASTRAAIAPTLRPPGRRGPGSQGRHGVSKRERRDLKGFKVDEPRKQNSWQV